MIDKHLDTSPAGIIIGMALGLVVGFYQLVKFVKHKILDCVGDMFMAGHNILGKITCFKSGHGLNNKLLRKIRVMGVSLSVTNRLKIRVGASLGGTQSVLVCFVFKTKFPKRPFCAMRERLTLFFLSLATLV